MLLKLNAILKNSYCEEAPVIVHRNYKHITYTAQLITIAQLFHLHSNISTYISDKLVTTESATINIRIRYENSQI